LFDLGVRRLGDALQQRDGGHDLAALAVPALDHISGDPGILDRATYVIGPDCLDRHDRPSADERYGEHTRTSRDATNVYCAGAACGNTASVLRARHFQLFAQHPKERGARIGIDVSLLTVDG